MYGIVKGLGYVWVGFGLGGKDDKNKEEKCAYLRKFIFPLWSLRRKPPPRTKLQNTQPQLSQLIHPKLHPNGATNLHPLG